MRRLLFVLALVLMFVPAVSAETTQPKESKAMSDEDAVYAAVLDYVEGLYEVAPERIERSVHPELAKRGFVRRQDSDPYVERKLTQPQLVDIAKTYNKDGNLSADAPKEITIYEVLDQTASVKLVGEWGLDYMQLAKYDGQWKIVNVMWQQFPPAGSQMKADEDAVRAAVLDYVEGVYDVAPERIERSVHPEMAKRGFARRQDSDPYTELKMTQPQLVELAKNYNKDGKRVPADAPKEVIIYEVLNQTASIKLIASWGIDYMHLAKYDGQWKIVNVMWQRHPPEA